MDNIFGELKLEPASQPNDGWLADNVLHPFANGTGLQQIYASIADKPVDLYQVPHAKTFSTDWCVQAVSSAAGAVIPFVVAGKLTGMGMQAASRGMGLEGGTLAARVMANEGFAQIAGAGLYAFAQKPADGQTRIAAAASTMAGFGLFGAGNSLIGKSMPSFSSKFASSLTSGTLRFAVGAMAGLGSYETANLVSGWQGAKHDANWDERLNAMAHGGFVNVALPVVQERVSKVADSLVPSKGRASQASSITENGNKETAKVDTETRADKSAGERLLDELAKKDAKKDSSKEAKEEPNKGSGRSSGKDILSSTESYEKWAQSKIKLVPEDLAKKHSEMSVDPFKFMRGTYYRWAEKFPVQLPELQNAPKVNSVGDLHVENFGTWKDGKGRSIWGVNDFDEAYHLPYTNDLVRLVTSANLMKRNGQLKLSMEEAASEVLSGYTQALKDGGEPFIISGRDHKIGDLANEQAPKPSKYWKKLDEQIAARPVSNLPPETIAALKSIIPGANVHDMKIGHRQAGLGSLGRERYAATAEINGEKLAAEVKSVLPSANSFILGKNEQSFYTDIMGQSVRVQDPLVKVSPSWVSRSLSPDRFKIEFAEITRSKDEATLLWAMGYEAANVHLGTKNAAPAILQDLASRNPNWLTDAVKTMTQSTVADQAVWKGRNP